MASDVGGQVNNSAAHTRLIQEARLALGREPDLVMWPMQPGGVADATGRPMRCGPTGMADLVGILRMRVMLAGRALELGRLFAIEGKTGGGKLRSAQIMWGNLVRRMGGFYSEFRSADDARACLERARMGLSS